MERGEDEGGAAKQLVLFQGDSPGDSHLAPATTPSSAIALKILSLAAKGFLILRRRSPGTMAPLWRCRQRKLSSYLENSLGFSTALERLTASQVVFSSLTHQLLCRLPLPPCILHNHPYSEQIPLPSPFCQNSDPPSKTVLRKRSLPSSLGISSFNPERETQALGESARGRPGEPKEEVFSPTTGS